MAQINANSAHVSDAGRFLENELPEILGQALSSMLADTVRLKRSADTAIDSASDRRFLVEFNNVAGSITFALSNRDAIAIERNILTALGMDEAEEVEKCENLDEVWSQSAGQLASLFSGKLSVDVTAKPVQAIGSANSTTESADWCFVLQYSGGSEKIWVRASLSLLQQLEPAPATNLPATIEQVVSYKPKNLDLLLDVELPVSISFGRTQVALKDVVKLTTGSVVELDRAISEPVDVIVNNCVVARGEVVVVDGNFGVRIKQVMSKQERINALQ